MVVFSGMKFVGKVNRNPFEVISIKTDKHSKSKTAIIKDLKTGKTFEYGLSALERCLIEIVG